MGTARAVDSMIHDGLWEAYHDYHMGNTGEVVADRYSVGRTEQDAYAAESHRRAAAAASRGLFQEEILLLKIPQKKGDPIHFDQDEGPRPDTCLESLARLRPVFQKEGTVTAGNSSQISDGAAALVVMSEQAMQKAGAIPLARVVATATSGVDTEMVMMAPQRAIEKVLRRAGWRQDHGPTPAWSHWPGSGRCSRRRERSPPGTDQRWRGGALCPSRRCRRPAPFHWPEWWRLPPVDTEMVRWHLREPRKGSTAGRLERRSGGSLRGERSVLRSGGGSVQRDPTRSPETQCTRRCCSSGSSHRSEWCQNSSHPSACPEEPKGHTRSCRSLSGRG